MDRGAWLQSMGLQRVGHSSGVLEYSSTPNNKTEKKQAASRTRREENVVNGSALLLWSPLIEQFGRCSHWELNSACR